jgi:hypothetical protein
MSMTPENTQKLYAAFPLLYRGKDSNAEDSSMSWGFECGDGWFNLIWNLSQAIEENARRDGVDPQSDSWPEAFQVKQKFGTLRFHLKGNSESFMKLIDTASASSAGICEVCGDSGSLVGRRYVQPLCREHAREKLSERDR